MAQMQFDATTVDPSSVGSQLPVSDANGHKVVIISSEIKPTKDNDGGYLQLELQIIEGPEQGKTGMYRLNLYNKEPKAVEIAYRQLSAVCHVTGVYRISNDSNELHNIPFRAVVGLQKGQTEYTEVKGVKDINGNDPGKQGQPPQNQPQNAGTFGSQQQQPQGQQQPQQGQQWGQPAQTGQQPNQAQWGQPNQQPPQNQPQQQQWQQGNQQPGGAPWGPK